MGNEQNTLYSCKCINVQLRSSAPPTTGAQSDLPPASAWTTVLVPRDEDIKIIYPHLTLRSRHRAPYIPDPTRCARYTTVTCLSCQTLVYRIHQTVLLDDEVNIREGPIIAKGWVFEEVLRSSSGWLEVSTKDVLVGEAVMNQQKALPQFSELFGIVLPASTSTSSLTPDFDSTLQSISQSQPVPRYQLPPIPAIFPEPKSTRSLFTVLAAVATRHSNTIRTEAEEYIDRIVKEKVEEIKRAEAQLKRNVLALMTAYSDGIKKAEHEQNALQEGSSQTEAKKEKKEKAPSPPASPSTPVFTGAPSSVIRDFIPMRITPSSTTAPTISSTSSPRVSRPSPLINSSLPRISALSASLATSSFHHPRAGNAIADGASIPPTNPSRTTTDADSLHSLRSASSATLSAPQDLTNVFQYPRLFDDQVNTAASFRYFQLEDEMMRRKLEAERDKKARDGLPATTSAGSSRIPAPSASSSRVNRAVSKTEEGHRNDKATAVEPQEKLKESELQDQSQASPKSKGKRKVTFDVQLDPPSNPVEDGTNKLSEDMLFDYEEETNEQDTTSVVLPMSESVSQQGAVSRLHERNSSGGGSPASFTGPISASLPASSHIPLPIPSRIPPRTTAAAQNGSDNLKSNNAEANHNQTDPASDIAFDFTATNFDAPSAARALKRDRHTQILNLLAASLPSHRAAWAGKNYEAFVRGAYAKTNEDYDDDEFDDGGDDMKTEELQPELSRAGIPSSVPVTINRPYKAPPLSLASYQPAVLTENMDNNRTSQADVMYKKRASAAALRRASYAERDIERGVDPGMFDYLLAVHHEEDEEDEDQLDGHRDSEHGENGDSATNRANSEDTNGSGRGQTGNRKGRDRAHKILEAQANNGVPDDEMWRSLI
ncbi:hypothetical protein EV359DRAFT_82359 [Lentinula novae-zelandiae]|nr:hypothetical protein EV359DRAFT_82359 [Lentinula novae-zelandiae]